MSAYLSGCSEAFVRQADVLLLLPSGSGGGPSPSDGWPAHSQLLARASALFADVLEAADRGPSAAAPLRVELPATDTETVEQERRRALCPAGGGAARLRPPWWPPPASQRSLPACPND